MTCRFSAAKRLSGPLIVFDNGQPVAVYPHQVADDYETIHAYVAAH